MKSKRAPWVASAALSASLLAVFFLLPGCGKKEEAAVAEPAADPNSPEVYMKDAAFRSRLADQRKKRNGILAERCRLDEALQAEKAKDPASPKVKELQAALDAADGAFESNCMATAAIVRERLTRKTTQKKGTAK